MDKILIGIDVGTTVLKVAVFDSKSGLCRAKAAERLVVNTCADGGREQDPRSVLSALKVCMAKIRKNMGSHIRSVGGIGMAAQGGSGIIADWESGEARTQMILWSDTRSAPYLPAIAAKKPASVWRRLSLFEGPAHGLGRIVWYRDQRPELFNGKNIYCGVGEFLYFHLTGLWRQDAGNALQIGCYDVRKKDNVVWPLALVGVSSKGSFPKDPSDGQGFVAPVRHGHETHPLNRTGAQLLGLSEGIPVAGPYMDHEAGYLAAVGTSKMPLQCSLGTAWVGNVVLTEDKLDIVRGRMALVLPSPVDDGRMAILVARMGNATWDWGLQTLIHHDHKKALRKVRKVFVKTILPPEGLTALPFFTIRNCLLPSAYGNGLFHGLSTHTDSTQLLRALAAGMAWEIARVLEPAIGSGCVDTVVLGGGASRGEYFRKLLAGLFAPLPVRCFKDEDLAGTRGVLYVFSRKAAFAASTRVECPDVKTRKKIQQGYELYKEIYRRFGV